LSLLVNSDDDGLSGFNGTDSVSSLLSVDGSVVSLEGEVFRTSGRDSSGESVRGDVEDIKVEEIGAC